MIANFKRWIILYKFNFISLLLMQVFVLTTFLFLKNSPQFNFTYLTIFFLFNLHLILKIKTERERAFILFLKQNDYLLYKYFLSLFILLIFFNFTIYFLDFHLTIVAILFIISCFIFAMYQFYGIFAITSLLLYTLQYLI